MSRTRMKAYKRILVGFRELEDNSKTENLREALKNGRQYQFLIGKYRLDEDIDEWVEIEDIENDGYDRSEDFDESEI